MAVDVRQAESGEWERYRALRMEMLRDSPHSFTHTLAEVEAWDDERWCARLRSHLLPDSTHVVAVTEEGTWVGQASGRVFGNYPDGQRAYLLEVYVTPSHRGRGLVDRLVAGVGRWAGAAGHATLWLDVHEDATAARAAYARLGFRETGVTTPYVNDPGQVEFEMRLDQASGS